MDDILVRFNKGFTLIELMITIVILSILVSIAIPGFQQLIRNNTVTSATNDLLASLLYARSEAIKREKDVVMIPPTKWSEGWQTFIDDDRNGLKGSGEEILNSYTPEISSIAITGSGGVNSSIIYSSSGRAKSVLTNEATDYFTISNSDTKSCIRFSLTGRPRVDKSGGCS